MVFAIGPRGFPNDFEARFRENRLLGHAPRCSVLRGCELIAAAPQLADCDTPESDGVLQLPRVMVSGLLRRRQVGPTAPHRTRGKPASGACLTVPAFARVSRTPALISVGSRVLLLQPWRSLRTRRGRLRQVFELTRPAAQLANGRAVLASAESCQGLGAMRAARYVSSEKRPAGVPHRRRRHFRRRGVHDLVIQPILDRPADDPSRSRRRKTRAGRRFSGRRPRRRATDMDPPVRAPSRHSSRAKAGAAAGLPPSPPTVSMT